MPSRISGSKLPLVSHCRAAFAPSVVWPKQEYGRAATYGSAFHRAVEKWFEAGEVDLSAVASEYDLTAQEEARLETTFDGWASSRVASLSGAVPEWGAGYDWSNGTFVVLPRGEGRAAYDGLPDTVVCGTLDLVRVDEQSRTGEVHDWKTGRSKLPQAQDNWQLRFGALLLARVHGLDTVRVYLHTVDEEGGLRTSEGELDALELDGVEAAIIAWAREAHEGPAVRPGEHCAGLYCPIRATCSQTEQSERELAPVADDEPVVYPLTGEITSPDQAMWILHRIKAVQSAVDLAEKMVRDYADQTGGIPSDGGKLWGRHVDEWTEPDLSNLDATNSGVLEELGLASAVERKLSTTRLKDALKGRGLKGKALEAAQTEALSVLEATGLARRKTRAVYTARKGQPVPPSADEKKE